MKKLALLIFIIVLSIGSSAFAAGIKVATTMVSENSIKVSVDSADKIDLTGYTINKGSSIVVYYINDSKGKSKDSIVIDIKSVIRPYKVILEDSDKPFAEPFKDIKDSQMKDFIKHLYYAGDINGYEEDNTFRPDNNITRAEFITIVSRMMNLSHVKVNTPKFSDLDKNHWAYDDVMKAVENGIIEGYDENGTKLVKLNQNVTLAEASKIIDEAFKINNKSSANYDVRFVKHWAKDNIQSLLNENIISSLDDFYKKGEIDRPAKRGEIAMLLSRTLGR